MECRNHRSSVFLLVIALCCIVDARIERRCGSIDIRNDPKAFGNASNLYNLYLECTVLDGDFTMSMITENTHTDKDFPVFSELREITGCVLIYQVNGLTTLGRMFPNLRVIGGHSLIMNYALVIYQNSDLSNIGLTHLTVIRNGGVRITENPKLCYARFINWDAILAGKIRDIIVETGIGHTFRSTSGKTEVLVDKCNEKDGCNAVDDKSCYKVEEITSCWNETTCQSFCPYHNNTAGPGCSTSGEKCHDECVGGCHLPNDSKSCHACRHVEDKGECLRQCPAGMFEMLERRCVTQSECDAMQPVIASTKDGDKLVWKAFQGKCHYDCPPTYKEDEDNKRMCKSCKGFCPKKCRGVAVDSIGEALKLKDCNIIEGNLEVEIKMGVETTSAERFTEAFGAITEITGYLLIRFSPAFSSLHMFKSLGKIHGQLLYHDKYALVVYENQNLNQLFNIEKTPLKILNGIVNFQNNRYLCYRILKKFLEHVQLKEIVSENDVSNYSNGDKAVCDVTELRVHLLTKLTTGFIINWQKFNTSDMDYRKFLGYQIFYKKVAKEDPNLSIDDDRSACADADSWRMQFVDNEGVENTGELIPGEPNTLYAYYVQTRLVNHPGARNAVSKIYFVKTPFAAPTQPRIRRAVAKGSDAVYLDWDEPLKPNGEITHYFVRWRVIEDLAIRQNSCEDSSPSSSALISTPKTMTVGEENTCSADKGCCKCEDANKSGTDTEITNLLDDASENKRNERAQFENAVQNIVFVQSCEIDNDGRHCQDYRVPPKQHRLKRHLHLKRVIVRNPQDASTFNDEVEDASQIEGSGQSAKRTIRSLVNVPEGYKSLKDEQYPVIFADSPDGEINVTSMGIIISGLKHYTEYNIEIRACQNVTAPDNFCSAPHEATRNIRTERIPKNDIVDNSTIRVDIELSDNKTANRLDARKISWAMPDNPNGPLLAFRVKIWQDGGYTPIEQCVLVSDYKNKDGIVFSGLNNGLYSVEIRTITDAGTSDSAILLEYFTVYVPGWLTWDKALYISAGVILVIVAVSLIAYRYIQRHFGKKVQEYLRQTISANPEYFSQMDVYKIDEWELKRDDLILHEEIGRGTFGKVFRGTGNNITSVCGIKFGRCAVKTVPECATNAERLHFLIEASVMKQFNTAFVVKLYGVVSDGQPVLVVMEMMDLGNLRDYLRARRPDSEENIDNAPLPSMISYFKWATQISDGMAYLESLKFVHRDLAARNCMISADESVKIGDFGMARDIYYHEYYKPAGKRLMPVRWMSPESLKDGKFTVKSDVWSYGIVLYEMLTLGQQPYAGLGNDQVFNYIGIKRNVLVRPVGCPDFWYDLMRVCWKYDPSSRPCFYQIVLHLKNTIDTCFRDYPHIREQGLLVFEKCYVIQSFDDIDDKDYDFSYNEDEEEAKKNKMLRELAELHNAEEDEYYKQGFGAPSVMDGPCLIGEDEDGAKFNMLTLQDLTHDKPEKPDILTKKQIRTRDKEREKFHKKQKEIQEKNRLSQTCEEIELAEQNSPMLATSNDNDNPEVAVVDEIEETSISAKPSSSSEKERLMKPGNKD